VRLGLGCVHVEVETQGDDEEWAEEDSEDGDEDDGDASGHGFGEEVAVAHCGHSDEDAPEAVAVGLKAGGAVGVVEEEHALGKFETVAADDDEQAEVHGDDADGHIVEDAFDGVEVAVFEAVLVAEAGGAGGGVDGDVDDGADDDVELDHQQQGEDVVEAVGQVDLVVGLEDLDAGVAEEVHWMRRNHQDFDQ